MADFIGQNVDFGKNRGLRFDGRTPFEWFINCYRIVRDRESGIVNDPDGWLDDPRDLIVAIRRIVQVNVESTHIVADLPESIVIKSDGH